MPVSKTIGMSDLAAAMAAQARAVVLLGDFLAVDVALEVQAEVVDWTPVDTGEGRSNWLLSSGSARIDIIEAYFPYPKLSKANGQQTSETANADAAKKQGQQAIQGYQTGDPVYIVNNVDHVGLHNDGAGNPQTQQVPSGFVDIGILAGVDSGIAKASAAVAAIL